MNWLSPCLRLGPAGALLLAVGATPAFSACTHAITLTETAQMNFATIGVITAGGTVTLHTAGTRSAPTGFFLSGTPVVGQFKAAATSAAANCAVIISFTAGTLTGTGNAMTINNFTDNAGASPKLNASGNLTFKIGADLAVGANQKGGSYSGTYQVTVIY
jgi:Mat/Ecp fimbriae major subunit